MRAVWLAGCLLLPWPGLAQNPDTAADGSDEGEVVGWDEGWDEGWGEPDPNWRISGFLEAAGGSRGSEDPQVGRKGTLIDLRGRLETGWENDQLTADFKGDLLYDGIVNDVVVDVRELSLSFTPIQRLDIKAGRQVLTWGTGDLLFLNDLFPKDWQSFFAGRDDEYLKSPSTAVRVTQYNALVNMDLAWTPKFSPDEYIRGERFSYFSPAAGSLVADEPPVYVTRPSQSLANSEWALRLFKTLDGVEYAAYAYRGFFKTPSRVLSENQLGFAPMTALGASLRRPAGPGLLSLETAWYVSRDDRDGSDPRINNSQLRLLVGYEWEAARNFTVGLQYYLEHIANYGALIANSPTPEFEPPQNRHVITTRLTRRALQDKLTWSLFAFVSPNDRDAYLRPIVSYRAGDRWTTTVGLNLFGGDELWTFLGQFEDNSNAYLRVRYNY